MPRKKLDIKKDAYLQVSILPDDKRAFESWCEANGLTMSEVVRREIAPHIAKGKKLEGGAK